MSCLGGGGSGRLLEIILCIRARHGIIRGGTGFALPRDYHHPSGSGEQLCWVGGRGSAEGRPKLTTRITPITGALPAAAASPRALPAAAFFPGKGGAGMPRERAEGRKAAATAAPRPSSRRAAGRGWEEPGIHWLHGARRDWLWRGFAGKCHLLGEFGWPLSQPVPRQGRDAGTRPCPISDIQLRLSPSAARRQRGRAREGLGWALEFPGKWENRDFSVRGSRRFPARCITSHHTPHETQIFNSPCHAAN